MAVTRGSKTTSLSIEIENGMDNKGQVVYKKKTISSVNEQLTDEKLYAFAGQVASILSGQHRYYYVNDTAVLQNA